jgi:hypothetical protein
MPKNQVNDLITDREMAYVHLLLSGTMTDRHAAEAVGLNPDTAAYTKAKPRVRAYMIEHRAAMHEQRVQQELEQLRRQNQGRERLLARLWDLANMDPERTRNSMSAQIKALSMIAVIEGLIPDRNSHRRAGSAQNKSALPPVHSQIDLAAWLREQEANITGLHPGADPVRDEDVHAVPDPSPREEAGAPDSSPSTFARPSSPAKVAPSTSPAPVPASAPGTRVPSSTEKKPDTWRLRL